MAALPLLALGLVCALPAAAPAQAVPPASGWVVDQAGLLDSATVERLAERAESFRQGSGHEVALLIVPALVDKSLEGFALEVARTWGLGREGENDGALLLVVTESRQMRIEVGRGLEGVLPDAICARIIRDVIAPRFQRGEYAQGLELGLDTMRDAIGGDYERLDRAQRQSEAPEFTFFAIFLVMMIVSILGRRRGGLSGAGWFFLGSAFGGRGRGGFGGGGGGFGGGGFGGFGGGGGFSGGEASGGW